MNGVTIKELEEGESYKYLGQDESIGYEGSLSGKGVQPLGKTDMDFRTEC